MRFWLFLVAASQFWRYVEELQYFAYTRYIPTYNFAVDDEIILFWPWRRQWRPTLASYSDAASADVDPKL